MEAPHLERKLVAILAADVEGFSRQMERDEVGTLAVLSNHRLIIDAAISDYAGRITSTAGDSVVAEFASVISVINCAVKIQELLAAENAKLDEEQRLLLRIGINVGDAPNPSICRPSSPPLRQCWRQYSLRLAEPERMADDF
jgi:adenylate cyclase